MIEQINIFPIDAGQHYDDVITFLEEYVKEPLYPGDERRIFGEAVAALVVAIAGKCNEDARQSLLRYARGTVLDAMGERVNTYRLEPEKASTKLRFSVSSARDTNIIIPQGTRATPDAVHYFATTEIAVLQAGQLTVDVPAEATEGGSDGNNFAAGTITVLTDLVKYISAVTNLSISAGGDNGEPYDEAGDDSYRERIRIAPSRFSTAGPEGAYRYWALSADADIDDVSVISDQVAGTTNIVVLMKNGEGPTPEQAEKILKVVNDQTVRPMNDLVSIDSPDFIEYDIEFTYYVTAENEEAAIRTIEDAEGSIDQYIAYQDGVIGRDLNPDKLRAFVLAPHWNEDLILTGALRMDVVSPGFRELSRREVARHSGRITVNHQVVEE